MEIGYKSNEKYYSREDNGPWKFCDEKDIKRIVGENKTNTKLSVMVDIGRIDNDTILPKSKSVIDMNPRCKLMFTRWTRRSPLLNIAWIRDMRQP